MADTSSWGQSGSTLAGHYSSSGPHCSGAPYYQPPPVFSSSSALPSYTLTHTFTFPSYLNTPTALASQSQSHSFPARNSSAYSGSSLSTSASFNAAAATAGSPSLLSSASSLSLSSSSPASLLPFPSPASSSDSSSTSPPSVRSRLSASDRKARRAAKHRAIDLTRRTRESAALSQLKQLLSPSAAPTYSNGGAVSDVSVPPASSFSGSTSSSAASDSKAAVLEQTVSEVMRLREVIAAQQAMLSGQTAPLHRTVPPPLPHSLSPEWPALYNHLLTAHHSPPPTPSSASSNSNFNQSPAASTLTSLSSDLHTLYSSFFLHSPYHLTLIQPGTAACIDTNLSFLSHARLPRSHVVGKRITLCPAVRLLLDRGDNIVADEFMGGRAVDCGRERQAANGLSLVRLYSGAEESVLCRFRYVLGDGRVADVRGRCWLTKGRFSGVVGEAPLMIVQSAEGDYVNVV